MIGKILNEKSGNRKFERVGAWNAIDYTIVTRKSTYAPYTDNYSSSDSKLNLNYTKSKGKIIPINRFKKLTTPINLDDLIVITSVDPETGLYVETDGIQERIRFYREVV